MKKYLAGGMGAAAVLVAVLGSGTAGAVNEYVGMTYEKAASSISQWGTPVIATREGSYLPTEQCLVVGSRNGSFLDSSGRKSGTKVMLDINCNDTSALNGHPGNSVVTPEGKKALRYRQAAKFINEDFAKAAADGTESWCAQNVSACQTNCDRAKSCSAEVLEFLGG